jgi:hypothetical protein
VAAEHNEFKGDLEAFQSVSALLYADRSSEDKNCQAQRVQAQSVALNTGRISVINLRQPVPRFCLDAKNTADILGNSSGNIDGGTALHLQAISSHRNLPKCNTDMQVLDEPAVLDLLGEANQKIALPSPTKKFTYR